MPHRFTARRTLGRWYRTSDAASILVMVVLVFAMTLYKNHYDNWIHELDIESFFLPWFSELGHRLRNFDIPGRNPYAFAGAPFAGDPESGWAYFPVMIIMTLFPPIAGFKILGAVLTLIGGISTYAFARVAKFGYLASLFAGVAYLVGPLAITVTYANFVGGMVSAFVPMAFLGVEIAARGTSRKQRLLGCVVGGFALSQILAAWMGQGAYVVLLMLGAFVLYRYAINSPLATPLKSRLFRMIVDGPALVILGVLYGAAGIFPRITANAASNIAGGNYDGQLGANYAERYPTIDHVIRVLLGSDVSGRAFGPGGAVLFLGLLAFLTIQRKHIGWFFGLLALAQVLVSVKTPGIFHLASLIPQFRHITDHSPDRILWFLSFPMTVIAAAAVDQLATIRTLRRSLIPLAVPALIILAASFHQNISMKSLPDEAFWFSICATLLTLLVVALLRTPRAQVVSRTASVVLIALVGILPLANDLHTSMNLTAKQNESGNRQGRSERLQDLLRFNMDPEATDDVGMFLQDRAKHEQPFRYVSYGGLGEKGTPHLDYPWRRFEIQMSYILQNVRPMRLRLETTEGYDPQHAMVYQEYQTALNGKKQNYHYAHLWSSGLGSPLLPLLNVKYVVVDKQIPTTRKDIVYIQEHWTKVYESEHASVYKLPGYQPRAWMVYDVRNDPDGLSQLANGNVDGGQTAFVNGDVPATRKPQAGAPSSVRVTSWSDDRETFDVDQSGDGLLVVSEVYSKDWKVTVDGKSVTPLQTNHALMGIPLTQGKHTVTLHYAPTALTVGMATSAITVAGSLTALGYVWKKDRRTDPSGNEPQLTR